MMADWGRTGKATSGLATKSREAHVTEPHCSGFDLVNNRLGLLWDDALYSKGFTVEAHGVFLTSPPAALKSTGAVSPVTTYSYDAVSNLSGYTYQQNSVQTSHTYDPVEPPDEPRCSARVLTGDRARQCQRCGRRATAGPLPSWADAMWPTSTTAGSAPRQSLPIRGNNGTIGYTAYDAMAPLPQE